MRLINQGKQQKCLIYSLAMLLDRPVDQVEADLPTIINRSHHMQELIDYLYPEHKLLHIEPFPCIDTEDNCVFTQEQAQQRWLDYLSQGPGLLVCEYRFARGWHCVAWDGENVYDPNDDKPTIIIDSRYIWRDFYLLI